MSDIRKESVERLLNVVQVITEFQTEDYSKLLLNKVDIISLDELNSTNTVAVFKNENSRSFKRCICKSLGVEGKLKDTNGNLLHAIVHLDDIDELVALEIFPWGDWTGGLDILSLEPVCFNENGVSRPDF